MNESQKKQVKKLKGILFPKKNNSRMSTCSQLKTLGKENIKSKIFIKQEIMQLRNHIKIMMSKLDNNTISYSQKQYLKKVRDISLELNQHTQSIKQAIDTLIQCIPVISNCQHKPLNIYYFLSIVYQFAYFKINFILQQKIKDAFRHIISHNCLQLEIQQQKEWNQKKKQIKITRFRYLALFSVFNQWRITNRTYKDINKNKQNKSINKYHQQQICQLICQEHKMIPYLSMLSKQNSNQTEILIYNQPNGTFKTYLEQEHNLNLNMSNTSKQIASYQFTQNQSLTKICLMYNEILNVKNMKLHPDFSPIDEMCKLHGTFLDSSRVQSQLQTTIMYPLVTQQGRAIGIIRQYYRTKKQAYQMLLSQQKIKYITSLLESTVQLNSKIQKYNQQLYCIDHKYYLRIIKIIIFLQKLSLQSNLLKEFYNNLKQIFQIESLNVYKLEQKNIESQNNTVRLKICQSYGCKINQSMQNIVSFIENMLKKKLNDLQFKNNIIIIQNTNVYDIQLKLIQTIPKEILINLIKKIHHLQKQREKQKVLLGTKSEQKLKIKQNQQLYIIKKILTVATIELYNKINEQYVEQLCQLIKTLMQSFQENNFIQQNQINNKFFQFFIFVQTQKNITQKLYKLDQKKIIKQITIEQLSLKQIIFYVDFQTHHQCYKIGYKLYKSSFNLTLRNLVILEEEIRLILEKFTAKFLQNKKQFQPKIQIKNIQSLILTQAIIMNLEQSVSTFANAIMSHCKIFIYKCQNSKDYCTLKNSIINSSVVQPQYINDLILLINEFSIYDVSKDMKKQIESIFDTHQLIFLWQKFQLQLQKALTVVVIKSQCKNHLVFLILEKAYGVDNQLLISNVVSFQQKYSKWLQIYKQHQLQEQHILTQRIIQKLNRTNNNIQRKIYSQTFSVLKKSDRQLKDKNYCLLEMIKLIHQVKGRIMIVVWSRIAQISQKRKIKEKLNYNQQIQFFVDKIDKILKVNLKYFFNVIPRSIFQKVLCNKLHKLICMVQKITMKNCLKSLQYSKCLKQYNSTYIVKKFQSIITQNMIKNSFNFMKQLKKIEIFRKQVSQNQLLSSKSLKSLHNYLQYLMPQFSLYLQVGQHLYIGFKELSCDQQKIFFKLPQIQQFSQNNQMLIHEIDINNHRLHWLYPNEIEFKFNLKDRLHMISKSIVDNYRTYKNKFGPLIINMALLREKYLNNKRQKVYKIWMKNTIKSIQMDHYHHRDILYQLQTQTNSINDKIQTRIKHINHNQQIYGRLNFKIQAYQHTIEHCKESIEIMGKSVKKTQIANKIYNSKINQKIIKNCFIIWNNKAIIQTYNQKYKQTRRKVFFIAFIILKQFINNRHKQMRKCCFNLMILRLKEYELNLQKMTIKDQIKQYRPIKNPKQRLITFQADYSGTENDGGSSINSKVNLNTYSNCIDIQNYPITNQRGQKHILKIKKIILDKIQKQNIGDVSQQQADRINSGSYKLSGKTLKFLKRMGRLQ